MRHGNGNKNHIRCLDPHLAEGNIRAGINDDDFIVPKWYIL